MLVAIFIRMGQEGLFAIRLLDVGLGTCFLDGLKFENIVECRGIASSNT